MHNVRLFDANGDFVDNFDEVIEEIEKSIHGENYYDEDTELIDTRLVPINNIVDVPKEELKETHKEIKEHARIKTHTIKDFAPVIFFIIIFLIIVVAGYYFLNNFDFSSLIG